VDVVVWVSDNGAMSMDDVDLVHLLSLDEDALLERLAEEVIVAAGPLDRERKRQLARVWLDAQRTRLREAVCGHAIAQDIASRKDDDLVDSLAALADLVASVTGKLPAATVAVLLVRSGLDRLCA
jgi:hypothetical protein